MAQRWDEYRHLACQGYQSRCGLFLAKLELGRELWKTDGTNVGTTLVKDIVPGAATSYVYTLTTLNGRLLFNVESPIGHFGLWQTDGTEAGTSLVKASSQNNFRIM